MGPRPPREAGVGTEAWGGLAPTPGARRQRPTHPPACTPVCACAHACSARPQLTSGSPSVGPTAGERLSAGEAEPRGAEHSGRRPHRRPRPRVLGSWAWAEGRALSGWFWREGAVGSAASGRLGCTVTCPVTCPVRARSHEQAPPGGKMNSSLIRPEAPHPATQGGRAERHWPRGPGGRRWPEGSRAAPRAGGEALACTVCVWWGTGCGAVHRARHCGGDPGSPPAPHGSAPRSLRESVNRRLASARPNMEPLPPGTAPALRFSPGPSDADGHFRPPAAHVCVWHFPLIVHGRHGFRPPP